MVRSNRISKDELKAQRRSLVAGMSDRYLRSVCKSASERVDPIGSEEDKIVDVVCFTSQTLSQYWPDMQLHI